MKRLSLIVPCCSEKMPLFFFLLLSPVQSIIHPAIKLIHQIGVVYYRVLVKHPIIITQTFFGQLHLPLIMNIESCQTSITSSAYFQLSISTLVFKILLCHYSSRSAYCYQYSKQHFNHQNSFSPCLRLMFMSNHNFENKLALDCQFYYLMADGKNSSQHRSVSSQSNTDILE